MAGSPALPDSNMTIIRQRRESAPDANCQLRDEHITI